MITELISMNGYGIYVWLSFGTVLIACTTLYVRTKKTLKKYEKEFLVELEALSLEKKNKALRTSKVAQQILLSNSKAN